jgi:hypothetical protein
MKVLYKLHMETGVPGYARCAALFDKEVWLEAMRQGRDTLGGLHANTHLAQINGFAARSAHCLAAAAFVSRGC